MSNATSAPLGKVKLVNIRLSFPALFNPKSVNGSEPKFSANFLLHKTRDAKQIDALNDAIEAVKTAKWRDKVPKGVKVCLHEADEKEYEGYDSEHVYLSASSSRRPVVVDRDLEPLTAEDNRPYAGCFVKASVRLWAQDNQFGKRVNAELLAVQFVKDGEAFGAAPVRAEDEFDAIDEDDDLI